MFVLKFAVGMTAVALFMAGSLRGQSAAGPDARTQLSQSLDGAALYKAYCASCHGADLKGVGPMTEWLKIQAPDFTRIAARAAGKFPAERVQKIIAGDESLNPGHGTREMPVWGPIFSQIAWDQDLGRIRIYNLAKYLESMQEKRPEKK